MNNAEYILNEIKTRKKHNPLYYQDPDPASNSLQLNHIGKTFQAFDRINKANQLVSDFQTGFTTDNPYEISKLAEEDRDNSIEKGSRRKISKKKKAAIAAGSLIGAAYLASAISAGDALAPFAAVGRGAKSVPNLMFKKMKDGRFGPGAQIGAKGISEAVRYTKPTSANLKVWELNPSRNSIPKNIVDKASKGANNRIKDFATGLTIGGGILAAHVLGDKLLSKKKAKKVVRDSYNSVYLTNPGIDLYHQTKQFPVNQYINDAGMIMQERQKSAKR